ncbi:protein MPE1 [Kwoniella heveanensis BCC8398]|uniref:Protein MPE1 n=1 Tax=Kwoniella heveanensis BCC8398 TaxID=1296120 RepID=A0A1B9H1T5_9TREE|nr:protein MPE1 [Kwoniella heveanensis BCC8398]
MSTVFYRWGAGRNESRVTFDGTHISVFDLKREIILSNKMGNGKDFDIGIYDNVTGEEFKDDNHQIPRSSSLIARRLPSSIKGRGNAQNYIAGTSAADALHGDHRARGAGGTFGSMSRRFDGREDGPSGAGAGEPGVSISTGDADEDAKIQAILAQGAETWEQMQEDMSQGYRAPAARAARTTKPQGSAMAAAKYDFSLPPDKDPPVGYICYRCGQKGHWIQNCPDNEDPAAAERKRFVRVTGIPRSFLKTVETPGGVEGSSGGAMLTADGGFVRAVPDQRQWQKQAAAKPRALTGADVRDAQPLDASITCPICKKLVWEAVRTPCCSTAYCEECITTYLVEHDFECPNCESKVPSLDKLAPDAELREKVGKYVDGEVERSKEEEKEDEKVKGEGSRDGDQGGEDGKGDSEKKEDNAEELEEGALTPAESKPASSQILGANGQRISADTLTPQIINAYLMGAKKMLLNPALSAPARSTIINQVQLLQAELLQMQMMANMNGMNGLPLGQNMGNMDTLNNINQMGNMGGMGMMDGIGMGMGMGMGLNGMNPMGMGMGMDMGMMDGMNMGMGMNGMGIGGNMGMNGMNGMNMGVGMGLGMNGMPMHQQQQQQQQHQQMGFQHQNQHQNQQLGHRGGGFNRGGRGGGGRGGFGQRQQGGMGIGTKRGADEMGFGGDSLGGHEGKQQRVT